MGGLLLLQRYKIFLKNYQFLVLYNLSVSHFNSMIFEFAECQVVKETVKNFFLKNLCNSKKELTFAIEKHWKTHNRVPWPRG